MGSRKRDYKKYEVELFYANKIVRAFGTHGYFFNYR
jgi:hypothetical protein